MSEGTDSTTIKLEVPMKSMQVPPSKHPHDQPCPGVKANQQRRSMWSQRVLDSFKHPDARVAAVVALGRRYYYATMAILVGLQAICMVYYLFMVLAYISPASGMVTRLCEAFGLGMATNLFVLLTVVHIGLFVGHALALLRMIVLKSIRATCKGPRRSTQHVPTTPSSTSPSRCPTLRIWLDRIFGSHGLLGFRSQVFDTVFLTRKVLQVFAQTVQARNFARLSSRPWLPALIIAMILANCWPGFFLRHRSTWSLGARRAALLTLEVVLDLLSLVAIPTALMVPYVRAYDPEYESFALEYWYDDVWFVNLLLDAQMIFVSTWYDLLYRIVFGINLLMGIEAIKSLVVLSDSQYFVKASSDEPKAKVLPPTIESKPVSITTTTKRPSWPAVKCVNVALGFYGAIILGIYIHTQTLPTARYCTANVRPWFATECACIVFELNCRDPLPAPPLVGTAIQVAAAIAEIDAKSLLYLEIRHCPNLEIPTQIQNLSGLLGIKIYDATLVAWPAEAALTAATHPKLVAIVVAKTNMSAIPPGLLSPDFPQTVSDIEFAATNLTGFPDAIADVWSDLFYLYIEDSLLTTIPDAILRMQITEFSVCGNNISRLPDNFFELDRPFRLLGLSRNPLTLLPDTSVSLTSASALVEVLYASQTEIEEFPEWLLAGAVYVEASASPLCDGSHDSGIVDCTSTTLSLYPFEYEKDVHQDWNRVGND